MALVPDSAPVLSLNEDYLSVHFLKEVVQCQGTLVKRRARAGLPINSFFPHRHCVVASETHR